MQLNFLGNHYEASLSQMPVAKAQIGGKYRGQTWTKKRSEKVLISQPVHYLKYRGIKYQSFTYDRKNTYRLLSCLKYPKK